jgi:hypothetical protein
MKSLQDILNRNNSYAQPNSNGKNESVFDFFQLVKRWQEVVGEKLAENTRPLKIDNKTLIVMTGHGAYAHQVDYLSPLIIERISTRMPYLAKLIKRIKFNYNPQFFQEIEEKEIFSEEEISNKKMNPSQFSPRYAQELLAAQKEFESVENEELKELLISLKIQSTYS